MTIKFKAKFGATEIEYEGSEEFLKKELPQVVETFSTLLSKVDYEDAAESSEPERDAAADTAYKKPSGRLQDMTVGEIAEKLDCKTGPDLALAACSYLTFVEGKDIFERKEILEAMQNAAAYYKGNFSSNLTSTIKNMVKDGKLASRANNKFALQATERKSLEGSIAS